MSPNWKLIALAIAALRLAGSASAAVAAALPEDPCALLMPTEIQVLAPNAKIGSGVPDASMAPLGIGCTYTWGPRTPEWGESALTITVIDAPRAYSGVSSDQLQQGILAKVKTTGPNAAQVPGVGDTAIFTFEDRVSTTTTEAYFSAKGIHLILAYHAGDSLSNKDKVVTLIKAAAARL